MTTYLHESGVGILLALDMGQIVGLASQILMAHAQKEILGDIARVVLIGERVCFHDLMNYVLNLICCLDLGHSFVDKQGLEPVLIDPDEHSLEATQLSTFSTSCLSSTFEALSGATFVCLSRTAMREHRWICVGMQHG